jgi:DNA-binding response OmpR family regulator
MERRRVLVVDDEPQITRLLQRVLERTGRYEVRTENKGADALGAALDFHPQLVLLDVCMPDMDGDRVAEAMREVPELRSVPVFFLTGLVRPDEIGPLGWNAGERVYIPKPVRMADLVARIDGVAA